ncbi:hypothetical protein [Bacillus safensis]|uniref:hypothetical protein n=1 Tax=Bacillus safensis TaxID=561879 RepID=UPI00344D42E5|nr:hypothetical protein [Salmonella enterica subsp. enterica serovar Typhi]
MKNKEILGYILIGTCLLISLFFSFNTDALIPNGYELALNGIVISKAIMVGISIYLTFKIGQLLIKKKE